MLGIKADVLTKLKISMPNPGLTQCSIDKTMQDVIIRPRTLPIGAKVLGSTSGQSRRFPEETGFFVSKS